MNFFEHQEQARKKTSQLVILFGLAVLTLIIMATLLVAAFMGYLHIDPEQGFQASDFLKQINLQNLGVVSLIVIAVVGGGSLFKLSQLSGGGKVIAEMLGGTLINPSTKDPDERKLLNVVEEMAIASGTPVPPVYVMADKNINAFAAGFNLNDAVIGVTRGCIEQLNRDELQGVIAHEFSHIVHGDMRINIRLMGILHGILLIGLIGYHLLDKLWYVGSRNKKDNSAIGIIALAVGLIVIGFGGVFFGNLIKSAVSRQREYLADSSAVQFTRNPDGIANALKKIGGFSTGAILHGPHVGEASHMFFGEATKAFFATHPPLADRIKRIQPNWDGQFTAQNTAKQSPRKQTQSTRSSAEKLAGAMGIAAIAEEAIANIGNPQPEHLEQAQTTHSGLPEAWLEQAHLAVGARGVIYALLISDDIDTAEHQLVHIKNLDRETVLIAQKLADTPLTPEQRLPIIDIALPLLGQMDKARYDSFFELIDALIRADKRIDLFEWSLYAILKHYLKPLYSKIKPPVAMYRSLNEVRRSCQTLFSTLAIVGNEEALRTTAFQAAAQKAELNALHLLDMSDLGIDKLSHALEELSKLYPLAKPALLKACVACICADGKITTTESELIRAIADTLDCPMPPIRL